MDKNHCWIALKYIKTLQFKTIPALKDTNRNIAVPIRAKKDLVQRSAFLKLPTNIVESPTPFFGSTPTRIS